MWPNKSLNRSGVSEFLVRRTLMVLPLVALLFNLPESEFLSKGGNAMRTKERIAVLATRRKLRLLALFVALVALFAPLAESWGDDTSHQPCPTRGTNLWSG